MKRTNVPWTAAVIAAAAAGWAGGAGWMSAEAAFASARLQQHQHHAEADRDPEAMRQRCRMMHRRMQEMTEHMQRMDAELAQRIAAMEEAEGDAKISAMEEAIRTLAVQRRDMLERRTEMMEHMMEHMGRHMMMGTPDGDARDTMMRCPMMQEPNHQGGHNHDR